MTIDGATALLLLIAAIGAALTAIKVWVWAPAMAELRRREALVEIAQWHESLEVIVAALTPDHGTSVADFVTETRETVKRVEKALTDHCVDANHRMDRITEAVAATNARIDHMVHSLAGVALRREDREGIRTRSTDEEQG